jgi:hypothetical protein
VFETSFGLIFLARKSVYGLRFDCSEYMYFSHCAHICPGPLGGNMGIRSLTVCLISGILNVGREGRVSPFIRIRRYRSHSQVSQSLRACVGTGRRAQADSESGSFLSSACIPRPDFRGVTASRFRIRSLTIVTPCTGNSICMSWALWLVDVAAKIRLPMPSRS